MIRQDDLLAFRPSNAAGKKGDFSDFEDSMVVGARWADLAETADLLGFTHNQNKKIGPEVNGDWSDCFELIVTQITTGIQKSISDRETHSPLKQMNASGWWWWCNTVEDILLAHFGPLSTD